MSQEKANLARIRDNQRHSRARRKEYLQQLEARLHQIELQGIEASPEIQVAARRVVDENKKLRGLLSQHGVSDDGVVARLQSQSGIRNGQDEGIEGQFYAASNSGSGIHIPDRLDMRGQCYRQIHPCGCGSQDCSLLPLQSTAPSDSMSCLCTCGVSASHRQSTGYAIQAPRKYTMSPVSNAPTRTHQQISDFNNPLSVSPLASSYQFPSTLLTPDSGLYEMRNSNDEKSSGDLLAKEGEGNMEYTERCGEEEE